MTHYLALCRSIILLCTGLALTGATGAWSPAAADTPDAGTSAAVEPAPQVSAEQAMPAAALQENYAPVAADDSATVEEGGSAAIDLFVNDTDEDGDSLSLMGGTSAAHGTLSFSGGTATYTPDAGFVGEDAFTYLVTDGRGGTDSAAVTVIVLPSTAPAESPEPVLAPPHHDPMPVWPQPTVPPTADVVAPSPPVLAPPHIDPMPVWPQPTVPPTPDVVEPAAPVVTGPVVPAPAVVQTAAQSGTRPAALPYVQRAGRPAELPFTGDAVDVLLPIGAGLLLLGAGLARLGRRRPVQRVGAI